MCPGLGNKVTYSLIREIGWQFYKKKPACLKQAMKGLWKTKISHSTSQVLDTMHGSANKKKKFSHVKGKAKVRPSIQGLKRKIWF